MKTWILSGELGLFRIEGYNCMANCNSSYRAGGVAVFIKDTLQCVGHRSVSLSSADCLFLNIKCESSHVSFLCLYRLQFININTFLEEIESLLVHENTDNMLILGDFNINTFQVTHDSD
uniref:Endonuclease/exonuclease/phosphatase domain-containing protein n=1 Tax=Lutzomyia longipalpis TaxID=7200 RepID=A0A1B0CF75_LUTLO